MFQTQKLFFLLFFFASLTSLGQTRIWLGTRQAIKLKNDYQLKIWQEQRYFALIKDYDRSFLEISLRKGLPKAWAIEFPIRYTILNPKEKRIQEFRIGPQILKTIKLNPKQAIAFRTFYQIDKRWAYRNELLLNWRNRVDFVQTWLPKWQSKLENEFWYHTQSPFQFERYRLTFSNQIELNKNNSIAIGYFAQHTIPYDDSPWERVFYLRYEWRI